MPPKPQGATKRKAADHPPASGPPAPKKASAPAPLRQTTLLATGLAPNTDQDRITNTDQEAGPATSSANAEDGDGAAKPAKAGPAKAPKMPAYRVGTRKGQPGRIPGNRTSGKGKSKNDALINGLDNSSRLLLGALKVVIHMLEKSEQERRLDYEHLKVKLDVILAHVDPPGDWVTTRGRRTPMEKCAEDLAEYVKRLHIMVPRRTVEDDEKEE